MTKPRHQEIIAAYLSGDRRVCRAELSAAVVAANRDPAYRERFAHLFARTSDWQSDCRALLGRLAEFAEYSADDLASRYPTAAAHLEACPACRHAFWQVKPLWTTVAVDSLCQTATRLRQRLAANLQLLATKTKTLVETGIAPLSEPVVAVAATADADLPSSIETPPVGGRREWRIEDESNGAVITLAASARPGDQAGALVECALELPAGPDAGARLQLADRASGRVIVSGPLSRFTAHPLDLEPGSYLIAIESSPPPLLGWEIPIDIVAGSELSP